MINELNPGDEIRVDASRLGKHVKVTGIFTSVDDANNFCEMYPDQAVLSVHKSVIMTAHKDDLGIPISSIGKVVKELKEKNELYGYCEKNDEVWNLIEKLDGLIQK